MLSLKELKYINTGLADRTKNIYIQTQEDLNNPNDCNYRVELTHIAEGTFFINFKEYAFALKFKDRIACPLGYVSVEKTEVFGYTLTIYKKSSTVYINCYHNLELAKKLTKLFRQQEIYQLQKAKLIKKQKAEQDAKRKREKEAKEDFLHKQEIDEINF